MRINKHDTNGIKPLLGKGELGYDDYDVGGDAGRIYVGTGSENIPLAKKSEVMAVDSKADAHIAKVDNPHGVTKAQVGLGLVDNTADASKNVLSATKWTTARTITLSGDVAGSASMDGTANVSITTTVQPNSVALGTDTTGNYVADITQGTGITVSGTAGEGWSPTVTITNVGTAGTYTKVTTNAQGQVTSGTTLSATDIPSLDASKITTGTLSVVQGGTGVTTSTGTGSVVLSTSPILTTPNIGVATGTSFNSITGLSATTPLMNGTATVGTSVTVARADHVHPVDTSRAPLVSPAFTGTPTVNGYNISPFSGFKNYIINGNFDVWQRGTLGFDVTNGLSGTYCDMYKYANVTGQGTLSLSKSTISYSGQTYTSLKITISSPLALSGVAYGHYFSIEDKNAKNLINKKFTVSFLMEVNYAGNYSFSIRKINDNGGVAASFIKLIPCVTGVNKVTITVPADASYISSNSTTGRGLNISIGTYVSSDTSTTEGWQSGNWASISSAYKWITQSGAYINIAQVQLEEGSVATPFENLSYALQYEQCRRYYRRYATQQNVNDLGYQMRTTPTEEGTAPYTYSSEI